VRRSSCTHRSRRRQRSSRSSDSDDSSWRPRTRTEAVRLHSAMRTTGEPDRARNLALMVGVAVLGLAVALSIFIQYQARDPRPPEDVPRAPRDSCSLCNDGSPRDYRGVTAPAGDRDGGGLLCLVGSILSVATIEFASWFPADPARIAKPSPSARNGEKGSSPRQPCCSLSARQSLFLVLTENAAGRRWDRPPTRHTP